MVPYIEESFLNPMTIAQEESEADEMKKRLEEIRRRHRDKRESLLSTFQHLREQAKDTAEYCGVVGQKLRSSMHEDDFTEHQKIIENFNNHLDSVLQEDSLDHSKKPRKLSKHCNAQSHR